MLSFVFHIVIAIVLLYLFIKKHTCMIIKGISVKFGAGTIGADQMETDFSRRQTNAV